MNRVEELTFRSIDDALSQAEQAELDQLLQDAAARQRYLDLLAVESALRATGRIPQVADSTVESLQTERSEDLERSVMRTISALPTPAWQAPAPAYQPQRRRKKWLRLKATEWLAVAMLAAGVLCMIQAWRTMRDPLADVSPVVLEISGEIGSSANLPLRVGQRLAPGTTLEASEVEDHVVLQYADGTQFELLGAGELAIELSPANGKQVTLTSGSLQADVAKQPVDRPLLVVTPHTQVRVLGTRFEVVAEQKQGTRIDLESGRIELVRDDEPPVVVEPDSVAVVPAGAKPIVVTPRPKQLVDADREINLPGLQSAQFRDDGQIIGATGWQVVTVHNDDRVELVPVAPQNRHGGRSGIRIWRQSGQIFGFENRETDQLVVWDAGSKGIVRELPKRTGDERRTISALSYSGDWMATFETPGSPPEFALWRSGDNTPQTIDGERRISSMAADPTGKLIAVGRRNIGNRSGNAIELIDAANGQQQALLNVNRSHPIALAFSAVGSRVVVGVTGALQVWDVTTHEMVATFEQSGVPMIQVALDSRGQIVAASGQGEYVWLWHVNDRKELGVLHAGNRIRHLAFSPDGKQLAVSRSPGQLTIWDLTRFDAFEADSR